MDRNVAIASVLIAVIMFAWLWWLSPTAPVEPTNQERPILDTAAVVEEERGAAIQAAPPPVRDSLLSQAQQGQARTITIETDLYRAVLSTRGATLTSFTLKEYEKFDQETPVQLVDTTKTGAVALTFTTPSGDLVDSRSLYFQANVQDSVVRVGDQPVSVTFSAPLSGGVLRQTYTFTPGEYEVGLAVQTDGPALMTNGGYELAWNGGIPFTEGDPETEALSTGAFALSGGEVEYVNLQSGEPVEQQRLSGDVDWIAVKSKYFTNVLIPDAQLETRGAEIIGESQGSFREDYTVRLDLPRPEAGAHAFRLYVGPMEFYRITDYDLGLYRMVDYGWDAFEWMTRPLAQYFFIPLFEFLGGVIGNYGFVIILFAVIVKLLTYPLTKSSYESMARMREMQPKMEALKEKHADDPQKQQEAMIRLYKETGVNPFGGCLPMLLQYPVLIALWQFFPSAIEIRQKSFLWANDLSAPDVILDLPFTIPLYGDFVAGFTLLMGLSLVLQMKLQQTPSTANNAQMQIMTYLMPVMLFLFFNRLAAGLSLYYLVFNVLSAVQQYYINKSADARREKQEAKAEAEDQRGRRSKEKPEVAVFRDIKGNGEKKQKRARP